MNLLFVGWLFLCIESATTTPGDPCSPSPCARGSCFIGNGNNPTFFCLCPSGFTGLHCETVITTTSATTTPIPTTTTTFPTIVNLCIPRPCVRGTCYTGSGNNPTFFCLCPSGYTGMHCETVPTTAANPCSPSPCVHGSCYIGSGNNPKFFCLCPTRYTGLQCETEINPCSPSPCVRGSCFIGSGTPTFFCLCPSDFTGQHCETVIATTSTAPTYSPPYTMRFCGVPVVQPITNRIVGGQVANPGSWPWVVLLVDDLGYISGSGVMIDSHVILTSTQHFEGYGYSLYDLDLNLWRVYAGEYNISTTDPHEKFYHIRRVIIHPGYNFTSLENDIAVVITTKAIDFNDHTRPACLPDPYTQTPVGSVCYLPGWGGTQKTGNEEVMNQVDLPIIDDSICKQHFPEYLPNTELCAGYENQHKDWCWDDVGSPLMFKANDGAWVVQGLASLAAPCTLADEPSVFEDVSMYTQWIRTTMADAGYPYQY